MEYCQWLCIYTTTTNSSIPWLAAERIGMARMSLVVNCRALGSSILACACIAFVSWQVNGVLAGWLATVMHLY